MLEPGICYIKKEFLLPNIKSQNVEVDSKAQELNPKRKFNNDGDNSVMNDAPNEKKYQKTNKKERKRGQNKNRPIYKEDRTLHLCHSLIDGVNTQTPCKYVNCRYVHELDNYMSTKDSDLGDECYVFTTKGYCPRGVTCRFATAHLDENGRNIKSEKYNETQSITTCNGIATELQIRLRKHDYDFTKSKNLLHKFEKLREEQQKATTAATTSAIIEKPCGPVIIEETPTEKPPVNFAEKLILAPLTTVGNLPFRRICKEFGADITCSEMACAVPLCKGLTQEWALTKRHCTEDIYGVQLCGNNPFVITQAAQLLQETAKVDFIDLNIGCPIDLIYQQGGGSALMRRTKVLELTVRSCAALSPQKLPFTVKMRTGVYADKNIAHELMPLVEEWGAAAVTLHGRSREQRYLKTANWQYIEECAAKVKRIPVIGNGDILNFEDYNERRQMAPHVSSVMIGRGALIKPWIFKEIKEQKSYCPTSTERFQLLSKYVNYGLEHWGSDTKGVETTRRFLLEWQSFLYRYIPYEILEYPPQKLNQRPQNYRGRDEMETLLNSDIATDWVKLSEMLLGRVPEGFEFVPKHKANAY